MRPAAATALLGFLLTLVAATFDAEPLYVPGVALLLLAGLTTLWVAIAARGVRVKRTVGARRTIEIGTCSPSGARAKRRRVM